MRVPLNCCQTHLILCLALVSGCASHSRLPQPTTTALSELCPPVANTQLQARVTPPIGWKPDPIKLSDKHRHQVWLSPTGDTAYGVIYFDLPIPIGDQLTLSGFLDEMKNSEGEANLISKINDGTLPGIRFVAEGGLYRIRCNLTTSGFHGWVVYAGTLRARPVNVEELKVAELARERTRVGL